MTREGVLTLTWTFRAAMHAFQKPPNPEKGILENDPQLRNSNIITYTGIDKREGLVTIAKRLLRSTYDSPRITF